jgi:hypothetical protein
VKTGELATTKDNDAISGEFDAGMTGIGSEETPETDVVADGTSENEIEDNRLNSDEGTSGDVRMTGTDDSGLQVTSVPDTKNEVATFSGVDAGADVVEGGSLSEAAGVVKAGDLTNGNPPPVDSQKNISATLGTGAVQNDSDVPNEQSDETNGAHDVNAQQPSAGRQQIGSVQMQDANGMSVPADNSAITGEFDGSMSMNGGEKAPAAAQKTTDQDAFISDRNDPEQVDGPDNASSENSADNRKVSGDSGLSADGTRESHSGAAEGSRQSADPAAGKAVLATEAGMTTTRGNDGSDITTLASSEDTDDEGTSADIRETYQVTQAARAAYPGLVFKVQVGAYNSADAEQLVTYFSGKGLKLLTNAVNESGMTTVMTGSYEGYEEAREQRDLIRDEGYTDAFVVVFDGQNRLNIRDVLEVKHTR